MFRCSGGFTRSGDLEIESSAVEGFGNEGIGAARKKFSYSLRSVSGSAIGMSRLTVLRIGEKTASAWVEGKGLEETLRMKTERSERSSGGVGRSFSFNWRGIGFLRSGVIQSDAEVFFFDRWRQVKSTTEIFGVVSWKANWRRRRRH